MAFWLEGKSRSEKISSVIQLICFIVIFVVIHRLVRGFAPNALVGFLFLVLDYIVTSLITFLLIRPVLTKLITKKPKK